MPTIEDFFGNYKFRLQGNTNPLTYPPGEPMSIGASPTVPGTAILRWLAHGKTLSVDAIPFDGQALFGQNLTGRMGSKTHLVDVRITLALLAAEESEEEKLVTGDLFGQSAGPLVGQWGAETPPPPFEIGHRVGRLAVQTANV
ncbi:MAG TPA: hypothetical protein VHU81_16060 [Thermoanaerobaculia bacterium]|jgi:hypothetical protein|nr:hypothetical protein [Thermoanaerobaculia bacterium]